MATLTVTPVDRNGVVLSGAAATATTGDAFPNSGTEFLVVNNAGATPTTVSLTIQAKVDGQTPAARTVTVANAATRIIGPFPVGLYNDANGRVTAVCNPVTSVTVQAITCPGA